MSGFPGPFKCPDCGAWWAGFTHRCQPRSAFAVPPTPFLPFEPISTDGTFTVRCTCSPGEPAWRSDCPVHGVQVTYTSQGRSS